MSFLRNELLSHDPSISPPELLQTGKGEYGIETPLPEYVLTCALSACTFDQTRTDIGSI